MVDMRSQNKGAAGCPKRSERVAGWLAVWLVEGCWLSVLMVEEGGGGVNSQSSKRWSTLSFLKYRMYRLHSLILVKVEVVTYFI